MNPEIEVRHSGFWPVSLVALSVLVFLVWQYSLTWQRQAILKNQRQERQRLVDQSKGAQTGLQQLATDLLELAQTDPEARALVEKYGITKTQGK